MTCVLAALRALPRGYSEGAYASARWGVTVRASADERRWWVWGEELGGRGRISGNLYVLADGREVLKPCEMPARAVEDFFAAYVVDRSGASATRVANDGPGTTASGAG